MSDELKKGSMRQVINNIYKILVDDECLLRLLFYYPERATGNSPLSDDLPNIKDMEEYWDIVDDRIKTNVKDSDLEDRELCRLYISPERRRGVFRNYLQATQGVEIAIYVHENYSSDMRIEWISDRLNELLALERIEGAFGKLDYVKGDPWVAPIQYQQYRHVYEFSTGKK